MTRTLVRLLVASLLGWGSLVGHGLAASAQEDPYGGTTTTTEAPRAEVTCELSVTEARVGASVTALVREVPAGATVRVLFGGQEVGRATAATGAGTTVEVTFDVPDLAPGRYLVTAVGGSFTARCGAGTDGYFAVLAAQTGAGGGGSLPRTGVYAGLLAASALALLLVGRALLESSRRRRARLEAALRAEAKHLVPAGRLDG